MVRRRAGAFRAGFAAGEVLAVLVERLAVARFAAGLRAAEARVAPPDDVLARVAVDLRAVVLRAAGLRAAVLRAPVERFAGDLRAPPELVRAGAASSDHLPDNMR